MSFMRVVRRVLFNAHANSSILSSQLLNKMPFYAVRRGRNTGIYATWPECQEQTVGFAGACFKKFNTEEEAQQFVDGVTVSKIVAKPSGEGANKPAKKAAKRKTDEESEAVASKRSTASDAVTVGNAAGDTSSETTGDAAGEPVVVYTDGCCHQNGKNDARAGIGVYWGPDDPRNLSKRLEGRATNNRAEIHAARMAVEQAKEHGIKDLVIHTDSSFLIQSVTCWMPKWKKNDWKLSTGGPVKNREDFEEIDKTLNSGVNVTWVHVAGHKGIPGNEAADKLANEGARKQLD